MSIHRGLSIVALWLLLFTNTGAAEDPAALRLVPFPKQVELQQGSFSFDRPLTLQLPAGAAELLGQQIGDELRRAGLPVPEIQRLQASDGHVLRLTPAAGADALSAISLRENAGDEDYALRVQPGGITCAAKGPAGLFYGVQTLCQLIRANRRGSTVPCLTIRDWPSLRWRCFQDDLTRGPSSTLPTLQLEVDLGARLKMNLFTYYMEYQFAFKKHPLIGPKDGSLDPDDLRALVAYGKPRHLDVLGNQQSFGHLTEILKHGQYAPLRETDYILCPVKEESYQLLDDLYGEVCPLLPFEMFNVCCDETWGLGTGPAKTLAEQIGVGGVYVRHIARIHDLLRDKHHKRMMMWGDIILQHPDQLSQVPKDTVMLTWGYGPGESFEGQIVPFANSGYEFFVCPGISNWSRILPDFGVATTNIRNFVRDGAKHGALGMLNTEWEDDGEALQGTKWHGYAWGAECAWNASTTAPQDFNRRIGAVLFGEPDSQFGLAIELLAETHRMPGMEGMNNVRFWQNDFIPRQDPAEVRASAERLLGIVRPAIEHLEACRRQSTVNAELLDALLLGARRMQRIGQRMVDGLEASDAYARASQSTDKQEVLRELATVERLVRDNRDAHEALGREFQRLWLAESKPFALDRTMARYDVMVKWYDELLGRLADARKKAEAGQPLPPPEQLGLAASRAKP